MSGRGLELRVLSGISDIFSLHGIEKLSVLGLVQLVGREVEIRVSCDLQYGQADRVSSCIAGNSSNTARLTSSNSPCPMTNAFCNPLAYRFEAICLSSSALPVDLESTVTNKTMRTTPARMDRNFLGIRER